MVIIGGGDTGSDCLGTSLRQGAKDVTVLQIMPQEPKERPANQPWPTFARLYKETSSMEEGFETRAPNTCTTPTRSTSRAPTRTRPR